MQRRRSPLATLAAIPERKPATEEISGLIERVTFHNDDSGFCVLRVKIPGQREETTVVGSLPSVTAGEWLAVVGQGQGAWAAIQGDEHEDRAAHHRRGYRAVPRQRLGERDRADSREEVGRRFGACLETRTAERQSVD